MGDIDLLSSALEGRYSVEREIGSGASARVYLCHDLRYGRKVALKLLRPELLDTVAPERFLREIDLAARLSHPHILPLLDSGQIDGRVYFVLPFVEGRSLRERLKSEGPLSVNAALQIARDVGGALGHAHEQGVVHRDVKPSNILLAADVALLADFGIARAVSGAMQSALTGSGATVGTPLYMSPEQLSGDASVDARSDIYSLACVVYEMLTGDPPFTGSTSRVIAARHLTQPPAPLSGLRSVPQSVEDAVARALAKTPADRFECVSDFVSLLNADATDALTRATYKQRATKRNKVVRRAALGATATVVAAVLAISVLGPPALDPNRIGVFPIVDRSDPSGGSIRAEQVATYLGYSLEGTDPLRWEEGRDWLTAAERTDPVGLSTERKLSVSRARGVGRMLDGDILRESDSLRVILRLYDVDDGVLVARQGAAGELGTSEAVLATRAVTALLADLLGDRPLDVDILSAGNPTAVGQFHVGEIAFRDMRIEEALRSYEEAVRADSTFALAALKGALAANWLHNEGRAEDLLEVAARSEERLPPRFRHLSRGLAHYFAGEANAAVSEIRDGLRITPEWAEGLTALGDVYFDLMPDVGPLDSLAKAAYQDAVRLDSDFKVPYVPLADYALWEGDTRRARQMLDEVAQGNPNLAALHAARLLAECIDAGPVSIDWGAEVEREPSRVLAVALSASIGGVSLPCAEAGARSLLGTASPTNEAWGAFLILQSLLAVQGRYPELHELMVSPSVAHLPTGMLYIFNAVAGYDVGPEATLAADALGDLDGLRTSNLWILGEFEAHRGNVEALDRIVEELEARAAQSGLARDRGLAEVIRARAVATRRSGEAVEQLAGLRPFGDLLWDLWGALVLERAELAELLLRQGRWSEAERVAAEMDSHRSAFHLLLLPRTLAVRAEAAEQLGRPDHARELRERLRRLRTG